MDVELDTDPGLAQIIALLGAVLTLAATALTWYTASAPIIGEVGSVTGFDTDMGKLIAILAILAALSALLVAWQEGGALLTAGLGLAGVLVLVFRFVDLGDPINPEIGFFGALVGCVVVLAGGGLGLREDEEQPTGGFGT